MKNEQMNKYSYNDMKINNESQTSRRIDKKSTINEKKKTFSIIYQNRMNIKLEIKK